MPKKDYPEFKSWKKLERYCKKTKTKCYLNDVESGAACRYCYIWISRKSPRRDSKPTLFKKYGYRYRYDRRRVCLQCYKKEKKTFIFWIIIILSIEMIILFTLLLFWLIFKN